MKVQNQKIVIKLQRQNLKNTLLTLY